MRAWFLSDPEQECTAAILQELGACVGPAKEVLATTGMEAAVGETMELSEEHLAAAFADTVKVSLLVWLGWEVWIGAANIMTSPPQTNACMRGSQRRQRLAQKASQTSIISCLYSHIH